MRFGYRPTLVCTRSHKNETLKKGLAHSHGPSHSQGMATRYIVTKDGVRVAGPFKTAKRARNKADRLDNEYGAYRHLVSGLCEHCDTRIPTYETHCERHKTP